MDRRRAGNACFRQMLHQADEEGQVARIDALLVQSEDVAALLRFEKKVGVLDPLRNAFLGNNIPQIIMIEKGQKVFLFNRRVDRHQRHSSIGEKRSARPAQIA